MWSINLFGIRNTWQEIESWKKKKQVCVLWTTEEGNAWSIRKHRSHKGKKTGASLGYILLFPLPNSFCELLSAQIISLNSFRCKHFFYNQLRKEAHLFKKRIQNTQAIQAILHQKLIAKNISNKKSSGKTENQYPKSQI